MRLNNLPTREIEKVMAGNVRALGQILSNELDAVKEDLTVLPLDKVEELRGQAKVLKLIIKLLP